MCPFCRVRYCFSLFAVTHFPRLVTIIPHLVTIIPRLVAIVSHVLSLLSHVFLLLLSLSSPHLVAIPRYQQPDTFHCTTGLALEPRCSWLWHLVSSPEKWASQQRMDSLGSNPYSLLTGHGWEKMSRDMCAAVMSVSFAAPRRCTSWSHLPPRCSS